MKLLAIFILLIVIVVAIYIYNNGNSFKSVTCVAKVENPRYKVLTYDENNKCPKDETNPFELTPQQTEDCLYWVYKDKNGNDVDISAGCMSKASSGTSAVEIKKELEKCGLVLCDE